MAKKSSRAAADGNGTTPDGNSAAQDDTPAGDLVPAAATAPIVDLNAAGVDQLRQLRGIGRALAERIVQYRANHGPFANTADILRVPGISQATYEAIAPLITTGGAAPEAEKAGAPTEEAAPIAAAAAPESPMIEPTEATAPPDDARSNPTPPVEPMPLPVAMYDTPATAGAAPEPLPVVPGVPIAATLSVPDAAAPTTATLPVTPVPAITAQTAAAQIPPQNASNPSQVSAGSREPHPGAPAAAAPAPSVRVARDWSGLMAMSVLGAILGAVLALLAVAGLNQGTLLLNERPEVLALTNQLDQQRSRADALQTEADSLRARLDALNGLSNRVTGLEANVVAAKSALDSLQSQTSALGQRTTAVESQLTVVRAAVDRFDGFLSALRALVDQVAPTATATPTQAPSSTPTLAPSATPTATIRPSDTPAPTSSPAPSTTPAPTNTSAPSTATIAASLTAVASNTPATTSHAAATSTRPPAASLTPVK